MPKSMATIFGLILAACAIGFNTWRYPITWPELAKSDSSQPAATQPTPPSPEPAAPAPEKPSPASEKPAPEPEKPAAEKPAPAPDKPAPDKPAPAAPTVTASIPSFPIKEVPPTEADLAAAKRLAEPLANRLVPVPKITNAARRAGGPAEVRRLPQVDPNVPAIPAGAQSSPGAIPIYPSTGIK